jgi:hypothetical protein
MEFLKPEQNPNQSLQHFSEVDEDLRRIAEREANKQFCPFGEKCYRKNPNHFKEFKHKTSSEVKNKNPNINKTDEKKGFIFICVFEEKINPFFNNFYFFSIEVKITDFFARTPTVPQKIKLEPPNDESDYEIEDDSEEDNCNKNVVSVEISDNFETPSKRKKVSTSNVIII